MKQLIAFLLLSSTMLAQMDFGTPGKDTPLPEVIQGLARTITVKHFPEVNHPIQIQDNYYWKHATAIYSEESQVTIIEFGAYLFYNDKWNLRQKYPIKEFDKFFGTKGEILLQAQPYVWAKNWRVGDSLYGGWALWYFIGITPDGKPVCGYQTIYTTSDLLTSK